MRNWAFTFAFTYDCIWAIDVSSAARVRACFASYGTWSLGCLKLGRIVLGEY